MKRGKRMKTTRTCKINSITKEQTEDLITLIVRSKVQNDIVLIV